MTADTSPAAAAGASKGFSACKFVGFSKSNWSMLANLANASFASFPSPVAGACSGTGGGTEGGCSTGKGGAGTATAFTGVGAAAGAVN